jgi:hypothetical protein
MLEYVALEAKACDEAAGRIFAYRGSNMKESAISRTISMVGGG